MTEAKHTPGPWEVTSVSMNTGNVSVGHKASRIVIADVTNAASFGDMLSGAMKRGGGGFKQDDCHTQFANARLISAAPELLDALSNLLQVYSEPDRRLCCDGRDCGCMGSTVYQEAEHYARKAISKAEGRQ